MHLSNVVEILIATQWCLNKKKNGESTISAPGIQITMAHLVIVFSSGCMFAVSVIQYAFIALL